MGRRSRQDAGSAAVGTAITTVTDRAGELAAPVLDSALETVGRVLDETRVRSGAALSALRGEPVARRWPWVLAALVTGAAVGAGAALLVRRLNPPDAPGAQDPDEVRAVVDQPTRTSPPA